MDPVAGPVQADDRRAGDLAHFSGRCEAVYAGKYVDPKADMARPVATGRATALRHGPKKAGPGFLAQTI
jgi:hypothetical protein